MLQIVLCENDNLLLSRIGNSINRILESNQISGKVVCSANNVDTVKLFIKTNVPNVFFLDIDLKTSDDGFKLAEKIREQNICAYIVFISCHLEYLALAFKIIAFDFLPKPVSDDALEQCLLRMNKHYIASSTNTTPESTITIKSGHNIHKLRKQDIVYVERSGFKTVIYTTCEVLSCYDTLESILDLLSNDDFVRVHKSFIANKTHIVKVSLKERTLHFVQGKKCYIGPTYKKNLGNIH